MGLDGSLRDKVSRSPDWPQTCSVADKDYELRYGEFNKIVGFTGNYKPRLGAGTRTLITTGNQTWGFIPTIPTVRTLRQTDSQEFKVSLGYLVSLRPV